MGFFKGKEKVVAAADRHTAHFARHFNCRESEFRPITLHVCTFLT